MDTRCALAFLATALFASALVLPAAAAGVYKTVAADGTVVFTDMPPPSETPVPEQPASTGGEDSLVARANTKVDLAERAFAAAREGSSSRSDGLRMTNSRRSSSDKQRAAFYMKDLLAARAQLLRLRSESRAFTPSLEQVALR